jgi:5-methylcytosine-specific restriction endonuclease McrA
LIDAALKKLVRSRASNQCEYCRIHQSVELFQHHIEHIIPRQQHGTDEASNLALSCFYCNRYKGTNLTAFDPLDSSLSFTTTSMA